nr:4Fe-4S dicluster domain-containing protein [uncultured Lachnoclostridium sp.]
MDELESRRTSRKVIRNNFEKNICPGCIHCGRCMEACLSGALFRDDETGFVLADTDKCTGCRKCQTMCPVGVIHYSKEGRIRKCDGCIDRIREGREPACVRVCCVHAISFEEI